MELADGASPALLQSLKTVPVFWRCDDVVLGNSLKHLLSGYVKCARLEFVVLEHHLLMFVSWA